MAKYLVPAIAEGVVAEVRDRLRGDQLTVGVAVAEVGAAGHGEVLAVPALAGVDIGRVATEPPEEVVERAVLHHQHDDGVDRALTRRVVEHAPHGRGRGTAAPA